jgi:hypothetical protein
MHCSDIAQLTYLPKLQIHVSVKLLSINSVYQFKTYILPDDSNTRIRLIVPFDLLHACNNNINLFTE